MSLGRFAAGATLGDRRIKKVKRGGLDLPFAELVLGAGDFSFLDRPQNCRLVEAGGRGSRREAIGHTHTHTIVTVEQGIRRCAAIVAGMCKPAEIVSAVPVCMCPTRFFRTAGRGRTRSRL